MEYLIKQDKIGRIDARTAAKWPGAFWAVAIVLSCGLWLALRGRPALLALRSRPATAELSEEIGWIDRRLAAEQAPGFIHDSRRECLLASLHWDRAARLAMCQYYRQYGMVWTDDRETQFGPFEKRWLRRDPSGDVAATRMAALRALSVLPAAPPFVGYPPPTRERGRVPAKRTDGVPASLRSPTPMHPLRGYPAGYPGGYPAPSGARPGWTRLRPLWYLSQADAACGDWDEAIGALIEITHYKPDQIWVWSQLAAAYQARGDAGRQELAEEQAWRVGSRRPVSPFITRTLRATPYARLAVSSARGPQG